MAITKDINLRFSTTGAEKAAADAAKVEKAVEGVGDTAVKAGKQGGEAVGSLTDKLAKSGDAAKASVEKYGKILGVFDGLNSVVGKVTAAFGIFGLAIAGAQAAWELLAPLFEDSNEELEKLDGHFGDLKKQLEDIAALMPNFNDRTEDGARALEEYAKLAGRAVESLSILEEYQIRQAATATGAAADVRKNLRAELVRLQGEIDLANKAIAQGGDLGSLFRQSADRKALLASQAALQSVLEANTPFGPDVPAGGLPKAAGELPKTAAANPKAQASARRYGAPDTNTEVFGPLTQTDAIMASFGQGREGNTSNLELLDSLGMLSETVGPDSELLAGLDAADQGITAVKDRLAELEDAANKPFFDGLNAGLEAFAQGSARAVAASILFGGSLQKRLNEVLRTLALEATTRSLFEGAAALASLAVGNAAGAALHGKSAAAYAIVAGVAAAGAGATGGLRPSTGSAAGASTGAAGNATATSIGNPGFAPNQGGGGTTIYQFNMAGAIVGQGAEQELYDMAVREDRRRQVQRGAARLGEQRA